MSNYSDSTFANNPNTPWFKVLNLIPKKSKVLDIGCSSGNFGEVLIKEKQCTVDGIELDPGDAKKAETVLNKVHTLNIETDDISMVKDKSYDIVYFGDVIEHLVDPVKTLKRIKTKLNSTGSVIFSIPNMTHISVRIMLMGGHFQYGKTGLLDKTHLHYYDLDEIKRVFEEAGFIISELDWVRRDVPTELLKRQLKEIGLTPNTEFIKKSKSLEYAAYQFIGKAKPSLKKPKHTQLPTVSPPIDEFEKYLSEVRQEYNLIIHKSEDHAKQLQDKLVDLTNSTSWKVTKPLRAGNSAIGKLKKRGNPDVNSID